MKFLNEIDGAHQLKTDASNRLVTDAEKAIWNGKASTAIVSTTAAGLAPKTTTSNQTDFLRRDGTWAEPVSGSPPNLTLTKLQLGDYEIEFNSSNSRLEFKYIGVQ